MRDVDERYELAYRESLRAIEAQQAAIEGVRERAGQLLAATAVAGSVLGGLVHVQPHPDPGPATWIALGSFVIVLVLCMWVLLPRKGWRSVIGATVLINDWIERDHASIDVMHSELAMRMEEHWDRNQDTLDRRITAIQAGAIMMGVSIVAWLIDVVR